MYVLRHIYYAFVKYFALISVSFLRFVLTKDKNTNFFGKMFGGYGYLYYLCIAIKKKRPLQRTGYNKETDSN